MRERARPKSQTFMVQSELRRRFDGLRSLWMTSAECKNLIALASWYKMKRLWASFRIFCLYEEKSTQLRCAGLLPWTRIQDRGLYRFRLWGLGVAWPHWGDQFLGEGWSPGRFFEHQWSAEKHRRFFWEPRSLPSFCPWPSRRFRKLHFLFFWLVRISWSHGLLLTLTWIL